MATLPNIGGALCSKLQSLADPAAGMPSCNTANVGERKIWTQVNFACGKVTQGGKSHQKCIYGIPAQQTAKHHAKFRWPPVSDVAAVMKTRCETH